MEEEYADEFLRIFEESIKKLRRNEQAAVAFSGGLDSSVLARVLKNLNLNFQVYVAGIKESKDISQAKKVAQELGINLSVIELSEREIEQAIPIVRDILQNLYEKTKQEALKPNPIPISFNLPLFFVAKYAKEKTIFVAQGPDEMLGGYTRHLKLGKEESINEMKKNTGDFIQFGALQNIAIGEYFHKKVIMPYLEKELVNFCISLPYDLKINQGIRKYILRKVSEKAGLSEETSFSNKRACQYGSGIIYVMKRLAKKKGVHISRYVREAR